MRGKAFKFGDNISTDHIAPGRLFHLRSDLQEFSKHVLEDADENFAKTFIADEIYTSKNELTDDAKLVQEVYKIKCPYTLKAGDYLRRKNG